MASSLKIEFASEKTNPKLADLKDGIAIQIEGVLNYDDYAHDEVFTANSVIPATISKKTHQMY